MEAAWPNCRKYQAAMNHRSKLRAPQRESAGKRLEALRTRRFADITATPDNSNTGVQSSLGVEKPSQLSDSESPPPGGVDYLEVSLYGCWEREKFADLRGQLDKLKEEAQELRKVSGFGYGMFEAPEGDLLLVEPFGVSGGCPCRWALKLAGSGMVAISIVDRAEYLEGRPSVRVSIPSAPCMNLGEENILASVRSILATLGFEECQETGLSRVDVCVDLAGVDTDVVVREFAAGKRIKLADNSQIYEVGNRKTGLVCGNGGAVMLRIYDKEVETRHDPDKRELLRVRRWGGEVPEHATRVEFQLRRRWLAKHFDIKTLPQWHAKRAEVVAYLTERWFRMTETVVDAKNKNHQRADVSDFWKSVQEAFTRVVGESAAAFLKPIKRAPKAADPLVIQARGCLTSAMGLIFGEQDDLTEPAAMRLIHEYFTPMLADIVEAAKAKGRLFTQTKSLRAAIPGAEIPF